MTDTSPFYNVACAIKVPIKHCHIDTFVSL